jgi:hypothetical protein
MVGQLGRECILLEEGIEDLDAPWGQSSSGEEEDSRQLIPLHRRISTANMLFRSKEYTTLRMTFKRKVWDSDGEICRRGGNCSQPTM